MLENIGLIVAGLAILVFGADWMVKGASRLAIAFGISPLVVGLTIVAFGTSAPELAVSVSAAFAGASDMAVANVVGSNLFNVLVVLGLSAVVAPLVVHQQLVRMDVPIMIGLSILLLVLAADGRIGLWDSALLATLVITYTVFLIVEARREKNAEVLAEYDGEAEDTTEGGSRSVIVNVLLMVVGLVALAYGAQLMVDGATALARALGVSDVIIGLTIVAVGTSLPELATSVVAAFKGERDIAIGNVVGSNIFNISSVLGFSGLASFGALTVAPTMIAVDIPLMIAVAMVCLPFFRAGYTLTRANGAVFFASYVLYVVYLVLKETQDPALQTYSDVLLALVVPAIIIGTIVVSVFALRDEAAQRPGG